MFERNRTLNDLFWFFLKLNTFSFLKEESPWDIVDKILWEEEMRLRGLKIEPIRVNNFDNLL